MPDNYKDLSGNSYTEDELLLACKHYDKLGYDFYIGTDTQLMDKKNFSLATCICPHDHRAGRTSKIFYRKADLPRGEVPNLRSRMLLEAYRSIEMAMLLSDNVKNKITIHLDVGETQKSKTSKYQQELQFLVSSQGFGCEIKPDSWASSSVADRISKLE